MNIRINQVAVDFALETETTLAELSHSMSLWADSQNMAISSILADGRAIVQDEAVPLSGISEVEVEVVPVAERELVKVEVVGDFFSLLEQACSKGDSALLSELHREYLLVRPALFPLLDAVASRLNPDLAVLDGSWEQGTGIGEAARHIVAETKAFGRELREPTTALFETLDRLEASLGSLSDLGLFFQKGQDRDGFELILNLFTLLEDLSRLAPLHFRALGGQDNGWTEFHRDLQPVLQEAEGALAVEDYILLTDLIEYELTPRLRSARSSLSQSILDPASGVL